MDFARLVGRIIYGVGVGAAFVAWDGNHACASGPRDPRPFVKPYHDGYVLVLWNNYTDDELSAELDRIRAAGADSLEIPLFGCQSTIHSSDVGECHPSNRAAVMRSAIVAISKGFSVTILPIVITPQWDWRGFFEPDDVDGWFRTYAAWMDTVAKDATTIGSPELIAGTEFKALYKRADQWKTLLAHLRTVFAGPVVVTANWDQLDYGFWSEVDAIGVSAYFPLSAAHDPSQDMLDRAWLAQRAKLIQLSERYKRPLHFTEVGYTSSTAAAATPWGYTNKDTPDAALQARCFEAFRKAWTGQKALVRASIWATSDPGSAGFPMSFETLGKPAEAVLRTFFAERPNGH